VRVAWIVPGHRADERFKLIIYHGRFRLSTGCGVWIVRTDCIRTAKKATDLKKRPMAFKVTRQIRFEK
jgi:hypothetical protein